VVADGQVNSVMIQGQRYQIRSVLDPDYVLRLAAYVDQKITVAGEGAPGSDTLRLSVLAALNIADELFRAREATRARDTQLAERASELEQMVDRVLMEP
jgi:cell division protein ZapA